MDIEFDNDVDIHGLCRTRGSDHAIAVLAGRQHGVIARGQLGGLGVGRGAIDHRLRRGRLHLVHKGVYAVGHPRLSPHGRWMAAVLAAGEGGVLSHRSAAALWSIRQTARPRIDVTSPRRLHLHRHIHPHRAVLEPDEITSVHGIPVTTVPRTLLDLAAVLPKRAMEKAINEAEVLRLADPLSLADLARRHQGHRGIRQLQHAESAFTRSELEARFLDLLEDAALPTPKVNTRIEDLEVDAAWPSHQLIVELDGYAIHGTRAGFERDRERDRRLQVKGWRVIRITWRQLHDHSGSVAAELSALLG